ncbi:hypothetical protein ACN47E_007472 [Coniothyrium glycines]
MGIRWGVLQHCRHLSCTSKIREISHAAQDVLAPTAHVPRVDLKYDDSLFHYTGGRFVRDESHELAKRHVYFDVEELARIATATVGARSCVSLEKYPDGLCNKSMLLTMDNGAQVVAKVPNPNAGLPHYTTASEVATMDFARNQLGTPIPRVLAWSSRRECNLVGAEYVLMERVAGVELERLWPSMARRDKIELIRNLVTYQEAWAATKFKGLGSLYHAGDLEENLQSKCSYENAQGTEIHSEQFVIGPSVGRDWFDDGRGSIECGRGPWSTTEAYHTAIGYREMETVCSLPSLPRSPITLCGPGTYIPTREKKLKALDCYLKLLKYLLPEDQSIGTAHMWHSDLHGANIFVDPTQPTKITGIIDWQSSQIAPLYVHACQPYILSHDGAYVLEFECPQAPQETESLDPAARHRAKTLHEQRSLSASYNLYAHRTMPAVYTALQFQQNLAFELLLTAKNLSIDGEAQFLSKVLDLEQTWTTLPRTNGVPFPLTFASDERTVVLADAERSAVGIAAMRTIREALSEPFLRKGIVRHDQYEGAMRGLREEKERVIRRFARNAYEREMWEEMWPFDS